MVTKKFLHNSYCNPSSLPSCPCHPKNLSYQPLLTSCGHLSIPSNPLQSHPSCPAFHPLLGLLFCLSPFIPLPTLHTTFLIPTKFTNQLTLYYLSPSLPGPPLHHFKRPLLPTPTLQPNLFPHSPLHQFPYLPLHSLPTLI